LTAGETAKLENQQQGINQQVNKEQNAASKNIYNQKHNARTQPQTK
jgi:hypothetical protein